MNFQLVETKQNGVLHVKDYEETLKNVNDFVKSIYIPEKIENDETKKRLKALRASINKLIKSIDDRRISIVEEMTTEFQNECKSLSKVLEDCQKEIGERVREYETKQKEPRIENQITFNQLAIEVKITSQEMLKKVTDFLTKNGCEYFVKSGKGE